MAITWRNLGQSSNTGNQLIAGASDTIASGLKSIKDAAQSVTDEGVRQYQTQSDVNTASILSEINSLSQEEVDDYNVSDLSNQFGSQFDSSGVAAALNNRVGVLRDIAKEESDAQRKDLLAGSTLATQELSRVQTQAQLDATKLAKDNLNKFNKFNREASKNIGDYANPQELKREITQAGQKAGHNPQEINQAINSATQTYNNNIAIQAPQQAQLDQYAAQQAQLVSQSVAFQENALENAARNRGIIPELVQLNETPDSKDNSIKNIVDIYQDKVSDNANPFNENSVVAFKSLLDKAFNKANLPNSNAAELKHFISLGFDEGTFDDDGLDYDLVKSEVEKYTKMLKNREGIQNYRQAKAEIQQGAVQTANAQAKDLARFGRMFKANNRVLFTGEGQQFDKIIPSQLLDRRTKALTAQDWFN